jgi:hypothetical protein
MASTRNRSISAYRANKNADPEGEGHPQGCESRDAHGACRLPRREERCLRARRRPHQLLDYGTSVPAQNTLYNADVFAYMERNSNGEW